MRRRAGDCRWKSPRLPVRLGHPGQFRGWAFTIAGFWRHSRARPSLRPAGGWPWGTPRSTLWTRSGPRVGFAGGRGRYFDALRAPPFDKLRTWLQVRASAACLAKAETCAKARNAGLKHRRGRRERPAGWAGLVTHLAHRVKRHRRSAKRAERASAHIACRYGPRSDSGGPMRQGFRGNRALLLDSRLRGNDENEAGKAKAWRGWGRGSGTGTS